MSLSFGLVRLAEESSVALNNKYSPTAPDCQEALLAGFAESYGSVSGHFIYIGSQDRITIFKTKRRKDDGN